MRMTSVETHINFGWSNELIVEADHIVKRQPEEMAYFLQG